MAGHLPGHAQDHSRAHVVAHRVKTILLLDTDHSHIVRDAPHVCIHKDDARIIGDDRDDFRDQLMEHDRVNLMAQYRPEHKAFDYPEISRRINEQEWNQARSWALAAGLTHIDL